MQCCGRLWATARAMCSSRELGTREGLIFEVSFYHNGRALCLFLCVVITMLYRCTTRRRMEQAVIAVALLCYGPFAAVAMGKRRVVL